ncbi:MAG TPA: hypothetical protein DEA96_00335 [Leptospiraceae bacterium]|nr:hypothetical protein [Spirochaetaceae bacterium]HBS03379.1 hypothetical protein [Leptospiraceae bacterium]|tara:strand:+ start:9500 stop:10273 length:774 start_codon:yes stop_codon:yes gene_type:complete
MNPTDDEKSIPMEDIDVSELGLSASVDRPELFLGHLKESEVQELIHRLGLIREIENRGYRKWTLSIETESLADNRIHIYSADHQDLFFLRLKLGGYPVIGPEPLRLVSIDWFLTQNIRARSDNLYPGQKFPGLGSRVLFIFKDIVRELVDRSHASGTITVPEYFHDAILFTRFMECKFVNPEKAADFENLRRLGNIRTVSSAIHNNRMRERKTGELYKWRHGEMVSLKGKILNRSLFDRSYFKTYKKQLDRTRYEII